MRYNVNQFSMKPGTGSGAGWWMLILAALVLGIIYLVVQTKNKDIDRG